MRVIGVDFSGAGADTDVGKTWIARGELDGDGVLTIESCCPISREDLTEGLVDLDEPAVVAMDFPFSVPVDFARHCYNQMPEAFPDGGEMPGLWAAVAGIELEQFGRLGGAFVAQHGEPKRACDPPESFSCLHNINPDMVPMTFRGMRMLNRLWQGPTASPVLLPPLLQPNRPDEKEPIILLEVMPGATLRSLDLPYKGYKNGQRTDQRRQKILNELPDRASPVEVNLRVPVDRCHQRCNVAPIGEDRLPLRDICRYHDDALDAVVAAITAALWVHAPDRSPHPPAPGQPGHQVSLLEGWLFKPYQINEPAAEQE